MRRWLATNTYLPLSNLLRFTIICTLSLIFFPTRAKSGTLFYHTYDISRTIPDEGGYDNIGKSEIELSGAPANAIITSVDVEYWIGHRWIGDLRVWLMTEHNGQELQHVLWDREGGTTHDIHEKETGLTTWNGLPANRRWSLCAADFAKQDEGEIEEWKIWVYFDGDGRTLIPQVGPYSQDFTLGKPDGFQGWEYYSTNEGRIQVVNGQLRMDDMVNGSAYSLNEAILHLALRGRSGVILTLDHFSSLDENDSLPSSFIGHANGDGILISADGTNWHLLTNLTSDFQQQSFDLDAAIQSAGISYSSDFRIKFQQYDDSSWPEDGRAFDNISITTKGPVPPLPSEGPFGTWWGTFNSTSYSTSGTISNWIMREDYTTESKWELHVGANTGFRIQPSGTYSFSPANNHLDFVYTGLATVWVEGQITDVPCMLDVNGTVFPDNASGSYVLKLFPPNLLPFSDIGTWQATRTPDVAYHVSEIEICTGWNYNDPNVPNDTTYDFCLALETDNTISDVEFLTPAGYTFQIPSYTHMQSDNIQTWHYALEAMPSTADLVGHWKMDDNAATTTVVDSSGKDNHGTARQNTSVLKAPGKINGALRFNGIDDYIDCGSDSSLDITGSISMSAWVKFNSLPNYQTIVTKRGTEPDKTANYAFRTGTLSNNNQLEFYYHDGTVWHVYTTSNANLTTGQWYHVIVTYTFGSGAGIKFYLDNNLLSGRWTMGNGNSPVWINIKPVTIGGFTSGEKVSGERLHGAIDDVIIFNRALPEAEIKALYVQPVPVGSGEYWRYEGKFTLRDALTDYGDGTYTITVHYKDGSQCQTTAWFGVPNTDDAIPQPTQKPVLTFPMHNSKTTSPVTFTWEPYKGANATSIALSLEKQDSTGECIDIEAPVNSTGSDPIELSPGIWNAKLFCNHWYDHSNPDGIALEVGKYSETDYRFEILDTSLVGHWKMDDNAATITVLDSSDRCNHGTARRNTSLLSTLGKINGALRFNGIDDYIDCGNDSSLDITGSISISAWVRFNSLPDYQTIVTKRGTEPDKTANYAFRTGALSNNNQLEFYYHDGTVWHVYTTSNAKLTTGQWYHVIVTYTFGSGAGIKFYLDNNLLSGRWRMGNGNSPVQINAKPVTIGGFTSGVGVCGERLNGVIDDLMIFNRVLSETEINALYKEGAGAKVF